MLVSIVIPIYNVEKYLNRCIESVVNQTHTDLDIILVDDGATDNCQQMCDEWAKKDSRIKVIHKKNEGLGMARNTGIETATGKYICFFDSDDYIDVHTIEKCYNAICKHNAEVVCFGYKNVSNHGLINMILIPQTDKNIYSNREVQDDFLPELISGNACTKLKNLPMSACMMMISTDVIKKTKWKFVSERDIVSEDTYSLLCLYEYINSVVILPEALYYYCENGLSLTHTYRSDRYLRIKNYHNECLKVCDKAHYNKTVRHRLAHRYISFTITALKQIEGSDNKTKDKLKLINDIIKDEKCQIILKKVVDDKSNITRKILFFTMRNRLKIMCYILLKLQNMR